MKIRTGNKRRKRLRERFALIMWVRYPSGQVRRKKHLLTSSHKVFIGPEIPGDVEVECGFYSVRRA